MTDRKSNGDLQRVSGGVLSSSEKSGSIYKRGIAAFDQNLDAEACFQRARPTYHNAEDFSLAVLGAAYSCGRGVSQGFAQAVTWYRKAADQGHAEAQNNLGRCSAGGRGVARDDAQAVLWYRKAADQGHAEAQNNLGVCYAEGVGVTQNYAQAVLWFRKAADQGHTRAREVLGLAPL